MISRGGLYLAEALLLQNWKMTLTSVWGICGVLVVVVVFFVVLGFVLKANPSPSIPSVSPFSVDYFAG